MKAESTCCHAPVQLKPNASTTICTACGRLCATLRVLSLGEAIAAYGHGFVEKKLLDMKRIEQLEFVIKNWSTMTIAEMSAALQIAPATISQWATRARKKGIDLPKRTNLGNGAWKELQNKFANKNI